MQLLCSLLVADSEALDDTTVDEATFVEVSWPTVVGVVPVVVPVEELKKKIQIF